MNMGSCQGSWFIGDHVMPIISVANPQGGAGKSTSTLVLATTLAQQGASVAILECDPNRPIMGWKAGQSNNTVFVDCEITESTITAKLDAYRKRFQLVIVDLESTASRLMSRALARSQLVIIPVQASPNDAELAARTIHLIQEEEAAFEKVIPYKILFTRTSPVIQTRIEKAIIKQLADAGVPRFQAHLNERAAFKAIFYHQRDLAELDDSEVNGLPAARDNALRLTSELVDLLTREKAAA
ncbi:ParA family protein [Tianweitania sp.]|uniref:ParA family protein n=1 Tax=Tianweitania sp. TaxID=2021634 RepID=UPI00289AC500|nr:ParA family protein [Tianweitania sp.]